ncbi:MAG: signal peptide peptidase SppA [Methanogenium sp.]|jgi:signal peptide peptidase SppA
MNNKLSIATSNIFSTPWAIHQSSMDSTIINILKAERGGELIIEYKNDIVYEVVNRKAIINAQGIFYNKCMVDDTWNYVICNLENSLLAAVDDYTVDEVILKIDSPGGSVFGVSEMHNLIKELNNIKPINAYINGLACSAFYWIPAGCENIYAYTQSRIGSIGVYQMHIDYSKFMEELGIKIEYIKAGKYKVTGNPHEPYSEDERKYVQESVNQSYDDFTKEVAVARGLDLNKISEWADGKNFETKEALALGLIDGIKTWQDVLGNNIGVNSPQTNGRSVMAIGEKKISELNAEDLQRSNSALYESILKEGVIQGQKENEGKISALRDENAVLVAQINQYKEAEKITEDQKKIRNFAKSLNLAEEGEILISENKSVVEAFESLAVSASKAKTDEQANFAAGAPKIAGNSSDSMADDTPKTDVEAVNFCMQKYNLSKRQAWKKARIEFEPLFGNTKEEENE